MKAFEVPFKALGLSIFRGEKRPIEGRKMPYFLLYFFFWVKMICEEN